MEDSRNWFVAACYANWLVHAREESTKNISWNSSANKSPCAGSVNAQRPSISTALRRNLFQANLQYRYLSLKLMLFVKRFSLFICYAEILRAARLSTFLCVKCFRIRHSPVVSYERVRDTSRLFFTCKIHPKVLSF